MWNKGYISLNTGLHCGFRILSHWNLRLPYRFHCSRVLRYKLGFQKSKDSNNCKRPHLWMWYLNTVINLPEIRLIWFSRLRWNRRPSSKKIKIQYFWIKIRNSHYRPIRMQTQGSKTEWYTASPQLYVFHIFFSSHLYVNYYFIDSIIIK
jgi:hypothetical protein